MKMKLKEFLEVSNEYLMLCKKNNWKDSFEGFKAYKEKVREARKKWI